MKSAIICFGVNVNVFKLRVRLDTASFGQFNTLSSDEDAFILIHCTNKDSLLLKTLIDSQ